MKTTMFELTLYNSSIIGQRFHKIVPSVKRYYNFKNNSCIKFLKCQFFRLLLGYDIKQHILNFCPISLFLDNI